MGLSAILFKLGVDSSGLSTGLANAESQVKKTSSSIGSNLTGALSTLGIVAGLKKVISEFARVQDLADRFGTSAESIQKIQYAAEQSGASGEMLMKSLTNLTVAASKADPIFKQLGISAESFATATPDEQMGMLADAFDDAEGKGASTAQMFDLLGARAADLVPLLKGGREEFKKLMDEAPVASDKYVEALARADDAMQKGMQTAKVWGAWALNTLVVNPAETLGRWSVGDFSNNQQIADQDAREKANKDAAAKEKAKARADADAKAAAETEEKRHQEAMKEIARRGMTEEEKLRDIEERLAEERSKDLKDQTQEQINATHEKIANLELEKKAIEDKQAAQDEADNKERNAKAQRTRQQQAQQIQQNIGDLADINSMTPDERRNARREVAARRRQERRAVRELEGGPDEKIKQQQDEELDKRFGTTRAEHNRAQRAQERQDRADRKIDKVKGPAKSLDDIYKIMDERLPKKAA